MSLPARFALLALVGVAGSLPAYAATHTVEQANKQFSVEALTAKKGDTITFVNKDRLVHNVFSQSPGNSFDLKAQKPNDSADVVLQAAGEVEVRCAIHPTMKMKITVN
jgi:plastocyanin